MQYCGGDHQKEHWSSHKTDCSKVKKAQRQVEKEIQQMRDDEPHENYFETDVGHFWGIHESRPYMRARFAYIEAILKIKSYAAATVGLENLWTYFDCAVVTTWASEVSYPPSCFVSARSRKPTIL